MADERKNPLVPGKCLERGCTAHLVGPIQLPPGVTVFLCPKHMLEVYGPEGVREHWGLEPEQLPQ